MFDLYNLIEVRRAFSPEAVLTNLDTPYVCEVIDHQGFEAAVYLINIGVNTDANMTTTILLEESDTDFSGSAVADIDMNGTELLAAFDFDDDNETRKLGYRGTKRYTRLTITPSGNNSGDMFVSALCILGRANVSPTDVDTGASSA